MLHGWGGSDRVPHARLCTARAVRLEEEVGLGRSPANMSRRSMMRQPLIANSHRGACLYVKMYTRWIAQDHRGSRQPGRAEVEAVVGFDGRMRIPNETAYHQRCPSPAGRRVIIKATHRMLGCFRDNALTRQFLGMAGFD